MATQTQQQPTAEEMKARLGSIRREVTAIEQDARFEAQLPQTPMSYSSGILADAQILKERARRFAEQVEDRADAIARAAQPGQYGWTQPSSGGSHTVERLTTVVYELLGLVEEQFSQNGQQHQQSQ